MKTSLNGDVRPGVGRQLVLVAQEPTDGAVFVGSAASLDAALKRARRRRKATVSRRSLDGSRGWERRLHEALRPWRIAPGWYESTPEISVLIDEREDAIREWILGRLSTQVAETNRDISRHAWRRRR